MMQFIVTESQQEKIKIWAAEQDAIYLAKQREEVASGKVRGFAARLIAAGEPYYGAIGGELEYCFCPTSLGDVLVVKHNGTNAEINVTDFESW